MSEYYILRGLRTGKQTLTTDLENDVYVKVGISFAFTLLKLVFHRFL